MPVKKLTQRSVSDTAAVPNNSVQQAIKHARKVHLEYVHDDQPGIHREKHGRSFRYIDPHGKPVKDKKTLERIKSLVIPPAYKDVWIAVSPRAHIQATGIDKKGRKQYRYHPQWRQVREAEKYQRMVEFAEFLPHIRRRVAKDLRTKGLTKRKILAAIVELLEKTLIRVGNEEYAKENDSYGLTTLHDRHVDVYGGTMLFHFKGKSGVKHEIDLEDPELARIIQKSKDVPGVELFQYYDAGGGHHHVTSEDVNQYLYEITGQYFTAKDFRTWHGTVLAVQSLQGFLECDSERQAKKNIIKTIDTVAEALGNTRAVCRKSYINPVVFEKYFENNYKLVLQQERRSAGLPAAFRKLRKSEQQVAALLVATSY